MKSCFFAFFIGLSTTILAQNNASIDVLHYRFALVLSDSSDKIIGNAAIRFKAVQQTNKISLDLVKMDKHKGMSVSSVSENGHTLRFSQNKEDLVIVLQNPLQIGEEKTIDIAYQGVPVDGLIISKNQYNHRTFFADNWPNRAHNWLPCVDAPYDKATVEFVVTAPQHYQVVGSGIQIEETNLDNNLKLTHWREDTPLATKIMAIGVADFAVQSVGEVNCTPVYSWVFPENRDNGFKEYAEAKDILSFFMNYIGTYGYKKLANVQSKTIFGGLENAGTIFYSENSATEKESIETLLAHEIAHQWFGDMVTEKQFAHLWLSEGFATYLTHIFMESKYGREKLVERLKEDRDAVISFSKNNKQSVIDSISPFMDLLNPNNYQKGGWVLHILRQTIGDEKFHLSLRTFYEQYKGKNADTKDFQNVVEAISGQNLDVFFKQWLYTEGQPNLKVTWVYLEKEEKIQVTVKQLQQKLFTFPLDVELQYASKNARSITFEVNQKEQVFSFKPTEKPSNLVLDPFTDLLFEGVIEKE